jgi:hypothetical protein
MKQYINSLLALFFVTFCAMSLTSCRNDDGTFENKVFINSDIAVGFLIETEETAEAVIRTRIAQREVQNIRITYRENFTLVDFFNQFYFEDAIALPRENFEIPTTTVNIPAGAVAADDIVVYFKNITDLNPDLTYVLPVSIVDANIPVLESQRTTYFVFKGAALINVVAGIGDPQRGNWLFPMRPGLSLADPEDNGAWNNGRPTTWGAGQSWSNPDVINNLSALTVEALIYIDEFRDHEAGITTILGIEGNYLIRIGDGGIPNNQLQLATSPANITHSDWVIPSNRWVHIALTWNSDADERTVQLFIDGVRRGPAVPHTRTAAVNWATTGNGGFFIGRSWNDARWFNGAISEVRIWNRVLTAEEINVRNHFYFVEPDSEGLAVYWRFNEGEGSVVMDHTGNDNHLGARRPIVWRPVELPPPGSN